MTDIQNYHATIAAGIIKNLQLRGMEGSYFPTSKECTKHILTLLPDGCSITWGGSESLKECGLLAELQSRSSQYRLIDRAQCKTPAEHRKQYAEIVCADYFLMSTNAITLDGELVNIDGNGNRVACLINGPEHVFLIVGYNKIVTDEAAAIDRVRNFAAPPNVLRLNRQTPCHDTGRCSDCLSADCICNHTVITRRSGRPGRVHIFLVGEELGY